MCVIMHGVAIGRERVRRWFFGALTVALGALAVYSVVAVGVSVALDRFRHYSVVAQVLGVIVVLALAVLAAWLARRSWHNAKLR